MTDSRVILLPVYRCTLQAIIEKGIHWSEVEHLILYALTQKELTTIELSEHACLPRSVAVESIVRLMRVGWVDMVTTSQRTYFTATASGLIAANKENLPPIADKRPRKLHFVIDQLTGSVISTKGIDFCRDKEAKLLKSRDQVEVISPLISDEGLPGMIDLVDRLQSNQDIIYSNEKIDTYTDDSSSIDPNWHLKLTVTENEINGLPETGTSKLRKAIYEYFKDQKNARSRPPIKRVEKEKISPWPIHNIDLNKEDIIIGGPAHKLFLQNALKNAVHHIVIYSTFIRDESIINGLVELFVAAAERGVRIDLLWDRPSDDTDDERAEKALDAAHNFMGIVRKRGLTHRIRLHDFPIRSHAKLMLYDEGTNYVAVVGSCNWLNTDFTPMEISVRLRSSNIVRDVLKIFEKLLPRGNSANSLIRHFFHIEKLVRQIPSPISGPIRAKIVLIGDHITLLQEACDNAQKDIFVASNRAGNSVENQVLIPLDHACKKRKICASVYFQRTNKESELAQDGMSQLKNLYRATISMQKKTSAHAKFLCWDNNHVVITSLNWLSKDDHGRNLYGEIGVYLDGLGLGDHVKESYLRG